MAAANIIYGGDVQGVMATFNVVVEKGEDGYYIAEVVGLPGCHTQAKTQDELMRRVKEAIKLYLKAKGLDEPLPRFIGLQQVEVKAG
jgi:predicted RNase H-like HicB family nuclease